MRTESIEDKEKEYMDAIGCPRVGYSIEPLLRQRKRKNGLASTFDVIGGAEASSGDELIEAAAVEELPSLVYSYDDLVIEDVAHEGRGWSRGESRSRCWAKKW